MFRSLPDHHQEVHVFLVKVTELKSEYLCVPSHFNWTLEERSFADAAISKETFLPQIPTQWQAKLIKTRRSALWIV
jgi:hypothetical protein